MDRQTLTPEAVATAIAATEGPALVTIPNVEIVSTGTYSLASGEHTFTKTELAAAVAAQGDPATRPPRLKIGHESLDVLGASGEPSFGKVVGMRLSDDGETILGDYVGVPEWLANIMPTAYPSRSIEADVMAETASGQTHDLLIDAVALLGVVAPGVSTLKDLEPLYGSEQPEGVTINAKQHIAASVAEPKEKIVLVPGKERGVRLFASTDIDTVRYAYYETPECGDWWWIREIELEPNALIVDRDGDGLIRVPFTINGDSIEFSEAVEVKIEYVPVEADASVTASRGQSVAVYASRDDSRPKTNEEDQVELTEDQLKSLGLPEDASQEQVDARIKELADAAEADDANSGGDDDEQNEGGDDDEDDESGDDDDTEAKNKPTVEVDREAFETVQAQAKAGADIAAKAAEKEKEDTITGAIRAGKFGPSSKGAYEKLWDNDPVGTKKTIDAMAADVIPVEQRGAGGSSESIAASDYPMEWLTPEERSRIKAARGEKE